MTLQTKFTVLVGLLSLTAAVSLGGAVWSVDLLEREVAAPFTATTMLTRDVRNAIRRAEGLRRTIRDAEGVDVRADPRLGAVESALRDLDASTRLLGELEYGSLRVGERSVRLLRESTSAILALTREWMVDPADAPLREAALTAIEGHLRLLGRVESQAVEIADLALAHVRNVRSGILFFQGIALITAVLAAFCALVLHRRWIVTPVERLRQGAQRLASGDLEHRMPEEGSDELSQLGREVNQMSETVKRMQAEAVEREKFAAVGQVVRRLTHNIRNPLAGIRSLAETSRDEAPAHSDVRDAQERIITTVDRFDRWLTDFLKATNPNRVEPRETSVSDWLDACLSALTPMAESAGVRLESDGAKAPGSAVFDPVQMEQALVALVTNAVEATPRGGRVEVTAARNGTRWTLAVEDDGPGVAPELAERLFEADYTTKPGGHGIGLTAARWIVRRHDGMIRLSRAGRGAGARFEISLPLATVPAPAGDSPGPSTGED